MFSTKNLQTIFKTINIGLLLAVVLVATPASALVMQTNELAVTTSGMVATAAFTLNTPCSPYTLNWGDKVVDSQTENKDMICIQVLQDVTLRHTYEKSGNYTVTFTQNGRTSTQRVSVPTKVHEFSLADVKSITSLWVDPNELMADEEYFLYTVTLKDGDIIVVKAGGFTTKEWIKQQFVEAGYTGDVDKLTALAESETAEVEDSELNPEVEQAPVKIKLQKRVIDLLKQIISLLSLR